MKRIILTGVIMLVALGAKAQGFAVGNLTLVVSEANAALGGSFQSRPEPKRLTLMCPTCRGQPMIDILLGRQTDGTEERVRLGETSMAQLEGLCQSRSPSCRLAALEVAPAVGWITTYPIGSMAGSTAVILRGGDLLTIRSLATDAETARGNAERLVKTVGAKIIGK
jgi:hypothetical protein